MNPLLIGWDQKKHPRQDQGPGDQNPIARVIRRYLNEFGHRFSVLHFDRKLGLQRSLVEAIIGRIMDNMVPIRHIQNGNRLGKFSIENQLIIDGHHGTVRRGTKSSPSRKLYQP
jgi:hypothetical protein